MSTGLTSTRQEKDFTRAVKIAFDELDLHQLAIMARHSPQQRLAMMFDLCKFVRDLSIAYEVQQNPTISDEELAERIRRRIRLSYEA